MERGEQVQDQEKEEAGAKIPKYRTEIFVPQDRTALQTAHFHFLQLLRSAAVRLNFHPDRDSRKVYKFSNPLSKQN